MSFTLEAPYPGIQTSTVLPSPAFGNAEGKIQEINFKRAIDGEVRTYVKRGTMPDGKPRSKMTWNFTLTRNKAIELLEFANSYHSSMIRVFDHSGREYHGYIMNNPLEISPTRRGAPAVQGMTRGELCEVTIEFEGTALIPPRPPIKFSVNASTEITTLNQNLAILPTFPGSVYGVVHNWDAWDLAGLSPGDRVDVWPRNANASSPVSLVKHPSGRFNWVFYTGPDMNYAPTMTRGYIGPSLPAVYFGNVTNGRYLTTAAMRSQSAVNFWPGKKGTVMWVFSHTIGSPPGSTGRFITSGTEFGMWGLRRTSDYRPMDCFSIMGGGTPWWPAAWRSTGGSGDLIDSPKLGEGVEQDDFITRGRPHIFTIIRDNSSIRYRQNGKEFTGRTINNYAPTNGYFNFCLSQMALTRYAAVPRGFLGQFIVWNRVLSATELATMDAYLSEKWSIPLEQWGSTDECYADWCITYPAWCGAANSYTPAWEGTPAKTYPEADIYAGVKPTYLRTCCDNEDEDQ